mmetsp:Transcript_14378/g.31086  ORF Transcript_14378/g.31086 Transcript_14378/m.31086 type:complete len:371 (-) Transcript_14378:1569-2681(-)
METLLNHDYERGDGFAYNDYFQYRSLHAAPTGTSIRISIVQLAELRFCEGDRLSLSFGVPKCSAASGFAIVKEYNASNDDASHVYTHYKQKGNLGLICLLDLGCRVEVEHLDKHTIQVVRYDEARGGPRLHNPSAGLLNLAHMASLTCNTKAFPQWTAAELREELVARGMPTPGDRPVLMARLRAAIAGAVAGDPAILQLYTEAAAARRRPVWSLSMGPRSHESTSHQSTPASPKHSPMPPRSSSVSRRTSESSAASPTSAPQSGTPFRRRTSVTSISNPGSYGAHSSSPMPHKLNALPSRSSSYTRPSSAAGAGLSAVAALRAVSSMGPQSLSEPSSPIQPKELATTPTMPRYFCDIALSLKLRMSTLG